MPTIRWVYPLRGIPMEASSGPSELGVFQCEAGCLLEERVEVELIGCLPGNQDSTGEEGVGQCVILFFFFTLVFGPNGLAENTRKYVVVYLC